MGVETDAEAEVESDPICSSAGCTQYKHAKKKPLYPMNYAVPNFGIDKPEVQATDDSLKQAEKQLGHKWIWTKPAKGSGPPTLIDRGMDTDIKTSIDNLNAMESKYGKWTLPPPTDDVQIESDVVAETETDANSNSDPICSSAGCTQYLHKHKKLPYPVDYPVPNNGVDHDILAN